LLHPALSRSDCTAERLGHDLPRSNHEASLLLIEQLFEWVASPDDFLGAPSER
jgi:hypothetical protein